MGLSRATCIADRRRLLNLRRRGGDLIYEGDIVRFLVGDIVLPSADELQKAFTSADLLEGTVINFSDLGLLPRVFAVVDVTARRSFVVPVQKLWKVAETPNAI